MPRQGQQTPDGFDPAMIRFATRSAERFVELIALNAPKPLIHSESAILVGLLAKVMRQCVRPVTDNDEDDTETETDHAGS